MKERRNTHASLAFYRSLYSISVVFYFVSLYFISDHYLMVVVPGLCVHLLDVGLDHLPAFHVITSAPSSLLLPNSQLIPVSC